MSEEQKTETVENPQAIITYLFRNAGYASYQLSKMEIGNRIKSWRELLYAISHYETPIKEENEDQEVYDARVLATRKEHDIAQEFYEYGTYTHISEYAPGVFLPSASFRVRDIVGMYLREIEPSETDMRLALIDTQKKLFETAINQIKECHQSPVEGDEWKQGGTTEEDM